jgi:hypothetical protein
MRWNPHVEGDRVTKLKTIRSPMIMDHALNCLLLEFLNSGLHTCKAGAVSQELVVH